MEVELVVEQAGCPSCAERVRDALAPLGEVREVAIDEADDIATVRAVVRDGVSSAAVDAALAGVSVGSGHEYRVRPGSWRTVG